MLKRFYKPLALVFAMLSIGTLSAQHADKGKACQSTPEASAVTVQPDARMAVYGDIRPYTEGRSDQLRQRATASAPRLSNGAYPTIWGHVVQSDPDESNKAAHKAGIWSFTADGQNFSTLSTASNLSGSYGSVVADDLYYIQDLRVAYGHNVCTMKAFNIKNWVVKSTTSVNASSIANALVEDKGVVYGVFLKESGEGYVFGTIELNKDAKYPVTPIAELTEQINSMAIDAAGQIYAISFAGDFYKVNKKTGAFTKIGATGVVPKFLSSACIDRKTGRMYWSVSPEDGKGYMYEVNTATGKASLICQLQYNDEIVGMYIPFVCEAKAPAAPVNVTCNFPSGSLTGSVDFTVPATTYDGEAASGSVSYKVYVDGFEAASGTAAHGAQVSAPVVLQKAGNQAFVVVLSNAAGESERVKVVSFMGKDTPTAPAPSLTYSNGNFRIKWPAVTTTVNGGYMDTDKLTYCVTRYPDSVVVYPATPLTSVTDPVTEPDNYVSYYYTVSASCEGNTSATGVTNRVGLGNIKAPWKTTFDVAEDFDIFTVIDGNKDGKTWEFYKPQLAARCVPNTGNTAKDDWLITPSIYMEGGKTYYISADAWIGTTNKEKFSMWLGKAPTAEAMTDSIIPETELGSKTRANYGNYFTVAESGSYYVGIHGSSDAKRSNIYIDDIAISAAINAGAPDSVTNVVLTPDANGAYTATLRGKTPTVNLIGKPLEGKVGVVITRNNSEVKRITELTPGADFSFTDNVDGPGTYTYGITAYNSHGEGTLVQVIDFIGINRPADVTNVRITESASEPGRVTLTWTAPTTDINGRPIPAGKVKYNIVDLSAGNIITVASGISTTSYSWNPPKSDIQDFVSGGVAAVTEGGMANTVNSDLIPAGTPYTSPYRESFDYGKINTVIGRIKVKGSYNWALYRSGTGRIQEKDADGTFGYMAANGGAKGDAGMLVTGKIDLAKLSKPKFSFYVYNNTSQTTKKENTNGIEVQARVAGDSVWTTLRKATVNELCNGDTSVWRPVRISLDAFKGKCVQLAITATKDAYDYTFIDALQVMEDLENNLSATRIDAPVLVNNNEPFNVDVRVHNNGSLKASGYSVQLFMNNKPEPVATLQGKDLEPDDWYDAGFTRSLGFDDAEENSFSARIIFDADQDKGDNISSSFKVARKVSRKPAPLNLEAHGNDRHNARLTWKAPSAGSGNSESVTDHFENYESFANHGVGEWTFIDGDGAPIGFIKNITLPNIPAYSRQSFFTFDSSYEGLNNTFAAKSGVKYLASMFRMDDGKVDDWAVSPLLSGEQQTITFWAKSYSPNYPEAIEVLYSNTGTKIAHFTKVKDINPVSSEWTQYSFDVPANSKYFAIRSVAAGAFMLMIDDVSYRTRAEKPVGYNVYRNNVKINTEPVTATVYEDNTADKGVATYRVTALYSNEESEPSNSASFTNSADLVNTGLNIYSNSGCIVVEGADGQPVRISATDGTLLFNAVASDTVICPVSPGVYIVTAGSHSTKLIVR